MIGSDTAALGAPTLVKGLPIPRRAECPLPPDTLRAMPFPLPTLTHASSSEMQKKRRRCDESRGETREGGGEKVVKQD